MAVFGENRLGFMRGIANGNNGKFNDTINAIKRSSLPGEMKKYFTDYLNAVRQGTRNNDFYDDEFLERVILEVVNYGGYSLGKYNPVTYFEKLILRSRVAFPFGADTEDFEVLKMLFINCIRTDTELFNDKLFTLFDNKRDYIDIINLIIGDETLVKNIDKINEFALLISKSVNNQGVLKREIVSFLDVVPRSDNLNTLVKTRVAEANKKYAIYDVDEKSLSLAVSEFEKARAISQKIDNDRVLLEKHEEAVTRLSEAGRKEIADAIAEGIRSIDNHVEENKDVFTKAAADSLRDVKNDMTLQGQKILRKEIKDASETINEIKVVASGLAASATDDMLRYQEQRDEMKKMLDSKQIQTLIAETNDVKELKEFVSYFKANKDKFTSGMPAVEAKDGDTASEGKKEDASEEVTKVKGIYIQGNDRMIVPISPDIIIPKTYSYEVIPAFDERIPFEKRFADVMEKKDKMKASGVLFHKDFDELITCLMEGEWPYLWGPSGSGKSYAFEQAAELLGLGFEDNTKITEPHSILGYNDAYGRFRATQTFVACLQGELICYNEFDAGVNETQIVLNQIVSRLWEAIKNPNKTIKYTFGEDMIIRINPNFRMGATANTKGDGPDILWNTREPIDESIKQRYISIRWDYDTALESALLKDSPAWKDFCDKFRVACEKYANTHGAEYGQGIITTRDADYISKYIKHNSKTVEQVMRHKFTQVKDDEYLHDIITYMIELYKNDDHSIDITGNKKVPKKNLGDYTSEELGRKLISVANEEISKVKTIVKR